MIEIKLKKNHYQAVYIEWLDSCMKLPVWHRTSEVLEGTKSPTEIFRTIGYMVNQNKKEYIIAGSIHFTEKEAIAFGQIFTIPKGSVTLIKKIKILTHV